MGNLFPWVIPKTVEELRRAPPPRSLFHTNAYPAGRHSLLSLDLPSLLRFFNSKNGNTNNKTYPVSNKGAVPQVIFLTISVSTYFNFIVPHYLTRRNLSLVPFPLKVFHPRWLTSRTGPLLPHFSIHRSHCQRNIFLKFINQRTVLYIWSPVGYLVLPLVPSVCVLLFCKV